MSNNLDSITITTIWNYFWRVCREMRESIERTATNVLMVTLHDLAYSIYNAEGQALALPEGIPHRLLTAKLAINHIREKFADDIHPGDVFLANTYIDGAVHLPDWVFLRPVFTDGELTFFCVLGTHVADNGGAQPGSSFLAYDDVAEGFHIPLVKIVKEGVLNRDIMDVILANNREADLMRRECASFIGSISVGDKRLVELVKKYGKETVMETTREMIKRTEAAVRAQIAKWPEGTWYCEATSDTDGKNVDKRVTVKCDLTIKDGELFFDYSKTQDETDGMLNIHDYMTYSTTCCNTFMFLGYELAGYHNEGSTMPIHVITRKGSLVDASEHAKLASGVALTGCLIGEVVTGLLSQALPEKAIAPYGRQVMTGGIGIEFPYTYICFNPPGGAGAVYGNDGYQCCAVGSTMGMMGKTDAEDEMVRFPWVTHVYEFAMDREGAGKWRGAPGLHWEAENCACRSMHITGAWDGFISQANGVNGGDPTHINEAYILKADGSIDPFRQRMMFSDKGDRMISVSSGGAGVGVPSERDPEKVRMDVKNELVSVERAEKVYKVVVDPETFEIDWSATEKLRSN